MIQELSAPRRPAPPGLLRPSIIHSDNEHIDNTNNDNHSDNHNDNSNTHDNNINHLTASINNNDMTSHDNDDNTNKQHTHVFGMYAQSTY